MAYSNAWSVPGLISSGSLKTASIFVTTVLNSLSRHFVRNHWFINFIDGIPVYPFDFRLSAVFTEIFPELIEVIFGRITRFRTDQAFISRNHGSAYENQTYAKYFIYDFALFYLNR